MRGMSASLADSPCPYPVPREPLDIALVGPPGVGKTTVAELIAERLGWEHVDTDDFTHRQVSLFDGEPIGPSEDEQELAALEALGEAAASRVVSLRGTATGNRQGRVLLMERFDRVFRLWCGTDEAAKRRRRQLRGRGIDSNSDLYKEIVLEHRVLKGVYDIGWPVDTSGRTPEDIADEIIAQLRPVMDQDREGLSQQPA